LADGDGFAAPTVVVLVIGAVDLARAIGQPARSHPGEQACTAADGSADRARAAPSACAGGAAVAKESGLQQRDVMMAIAQIAIILAMVAIYLADFVD
jgi:hypothetical protein